jgi:4-hydroxy-tetrahydrodipicolinate reductase
MSDSYISLVGAPGRMIQSIVSCLPGDMQVVEFLGQPDSPFIGTKFSKYVPSFEGDHVIVERLSADCDVLVDFALGDGFLELLEFCKKKNCAFVSGRTGISDSDQEALRTASKKIPILHARNMSLGANLLMEIAAQVARSLPVADIEIMETHHVHKKDAPSGTALAILESIRKVRQKTNEKQVIFGRQGLIGEKPEQEICVHSIRNGSTVGDHRVYYGMEGERLVLAHEAQDRKIFARGALTAVRWIQGKKPGFWTMRDVLGF